MQQRTPAERAEDRAPGLVRSSRFAQIATEMMATSRDGIRLVGDLDDMPYVPRRASAGHEVSVSPDVAASAAIGVLIASGLARGTAS